LWAVVPSNEGPAEIIGRAMRVAQQAVMRAASEHAVIEQARKRAEAIMCSFFKDTLHWSIAVRWADKADVR